MHTVRHNKVRDIVMIKTAQANVSCFSEHTEEHSRLDTIAYPHNKPMATDIKVIDTCTGTGTVKGEMTTKAKQTTDHHTVAVTRLEASFYPLVFNIYGGTLSKSPVHEYITTMAGFMQDNRRPIEINDYIMEFQMELACAIQRGNAAIARTSHAYAHRHIYTDRYTN
jgi:hypothetical protein